MEKHFLLIGKNNWNFNTGKSVRGSCRRIATLWRENNFQLTNWYSTQHWIFTELYHCSSKSTFSLFNLYVPVNNLEKKECWLSLSDFLVSKSPTNIIIASDLNITLAPNEKKGGIHGKDHLQDTIEELIQFWELIDLKPKTRCFTWSNQRVGAASIFERLIEGIIVNSYIYVYIVCNVNGIDELCV